MDDEDRTAASAAPGQGSPDALDGLERRARETLSTLEDLNSAFPATKEFLAARGLTNIRDLDKDGLRELKEHLERTLTNLRKGEK